MAMNLIKPNFHRAYPVAARAIGSAIIAEDGRQWIDAASGAIACAIGHGDQRVAAAVMEQMERASFVYRTQFTNEPAERLAARLCARLGYSAAFFTNSGSEAIEVAVRIAQQFWRESGRPEKSRILSRRLSYHGATVGALGVSGHWPRRRAAGPLSGEPTLPTPYCLRCPLDHKPDTCELACAKTVERQIGEHGPDNVAAVLIEPIVGASGAGIVPPKGYLRRVREICDRRDALLIADEVLTGLGRTGRWLAMEHGGVKADIVCVGKGLNAGYLPISGVLISERVAAGLRAGSGSFPLGHTHSNHPVAAAAANAVLDCLESDDLIARAETSGAILGERLRLIASRHATIGDVRGTGMLWGVEIVEPRSGEPLPAGCGAAERLVDIAFDLGLVIYPSSGFAAEKGGDAIIVAPPLNVAKAEIDAIVDRLDLALSKFEAELFQIRGGSVAAE
jgi:adenosylmethionine-8-amino-7-oxononanoate aminotransferase